ncbi:hypothetical protein NKJ33_02995 [Mesorhizobium sp. M0155]
MSECLSGEINCAQQVDAQHLQPDRASEPQGFKDYQAGALLTIITNLPNA